MPQLWRRPVPLPSNPRPCCPSLPVDLCRQEFAEYVRAGTDTGHLAADDMCVLASIGCR
jgi:hypothetical protein